MSPRLIRSLPALSLVLLVLAAAPVSAATLALAVEEFGCVNLVDVDVPEIQLLPNCAVIPVAGDVVFPDMLALWAEGDGFAAVARDFGNLDTFVAHFPSLAMQNFATGGLFGTRGPDLVFPPGLGANPEVRDGALLGDGTVLVLVEDQGIGLFWVAELDPATGAVTAIAAIDPDLDSSFEGGIADLGGGEALVALLDQSFGPALYAVDLAGGTVDRLGVVIRSGLSVSSPTALTPRPDGTGFFYSQFGDLVDLVIEPTASGRRGRFTGSLFAGRQEWYQPSFIDPMLVFLTPGGLPPGCVPDGETLCLLDGRYQVSVAWDTGAATGGGIAVQTTSDGGEFYFFSPNNIEMLVKVLDGCSINGNVWVFAAATTQVGFELRVEDTATGAVRTYVNPPNTLAVTRTDTEAFPGGCTAATVPTEKAKELADAIARKRALAGR